MKAWRALPDLLAHEDVVIVTVAQTRGSVPREAGTTMLVSLTRTVDTIGGGHLEWEAMAQARAMLLASSEPALQRFSLGASLGQCCGGVVWLVFERLARSEREAWLERLGLLDQGLRRELSGPMLERSVGSRSKPDETQRNPGACQLTYPNPKRWHFTQHLTPPTFNITIFGAGHVGAAIVHVLATLDAKIRWVDMRDDLFGAISDKVHCITTDSPTDAVDDAPPNTFFLVLTHDHALDLALTTRILRRDAFAWFGLIGSHSKRARFEHRLLAQGIAPTQLARMVCPMGIAGIADKSPQSIAIAVVAQLLQAKEIHDQKTENYKHNPHVSSFPPSRG